MRFSKLSTKILLTAALLALSGLNHHLPAQDTVKSKVTFGVRFISNYDFEVNRDYNFRTVHLAPLFSVHVRHHNFYAGPQYSYIFQDPAAGVTYDKNSFGLNFGYRYYSNFLFKNTRLFGEFNYSIFWVKSVSYQLGPPYETKHEEVYPENTVSIGLDYSIRKKLHLFIGFGYGSYEGFILIFEHLTLTSCVGIEYVL
jgi:hypothetical protein